MPIADGPFDANDPYNRLADDLRKQVAEIASKAVRTKDYKSLSPTSQVECLMAGLTVGLIGVCFAHIENAGRDTMMDLIAEYLPQAREQAEGIFEDAARQHS